MAQLTIRREDEELIIKKKLFYDGHGNGEDKKLVAIIKNVTKLCLVEFQPPELHKLQELLLKDISAAINATDRQLQVSNRCDRTIPGLEAAIVQEENRLEEIKSELAKLELELDYVEKLKQISIYPDCQTTEAAIAKVKSKMDDLMAKMIKYRNHIKTILTSCENMRPIIENTD